MGHGTGPSRQPHVVVVGSANIDLIAYADRVPEAGETLVGNSFQMGFGGKGANQAVMVRLMGARVSMVNCLGDDLYGDMTIENFSGYGIDTTHVHRVPGSSGVAPIWVERDGTNRIIIVPGANHALTPDQAAAAIDQAADPAAVVGQFEIPQEVTAAAFARAQELGAVTILNPAPAAAIDDDLLRHTDWLIPNEVELGMLTAGASIDDRSLAAFAERTRTRLLVTMGEAGVSLVGEDGDVEHIPAPSVTAVDTTGAGDAFVGGFTYGLAAGLPETTAARLGVVVASESVTRTGTQSSFPSPHACTEIVGRLSPSAEG